jgi:predicted transcriptional regulator
MSSSRRWYQSDTISVMALTVRTDDEMEEALSALARAEGTSKQEIIRRAVLDRYDRSGHVRRVDDSARRMAERWGDVLERLGTE